MFSSTSRIDSLDAIRGLLAIGVMTYHLLGWTGTARLLTLGTYGVYAFFVLSGFALEWVYSRRIRAEGGARRYGAARVGRILPLYVGAALATALLAVLAGRSIQGTDLLLNLTLTFGFINPGETSTVVGGWSIGIEVVFYVLFPLIAWLGLRTRWLIVLAGVALGVRMVYIGAILPAGPAFGDAWVAYSQMPSFLWFFLAGMVGARLVAARESHVRPGEDSSDASEASEPSRARAIWPFVVGLAILLAVTLASAVEDTHAMFVGPLGLALSVAVAAAVVIAAYAAPWHGLASRAARVLGDISYGTYLLHPIIWGTLLLIGLRERNAAIITLVAAPVLAYLVHRLMEVPAGLAIRSALAPRRMAAPVPEATPGA